MDGESGLYTPAISGDNETTEAHCTRQCIVEDHNTLDRPRNDISTFTMAFLRSCKVWINNYTHDAVSMALPSLSYQSCML